MMNFNSNHPFHMVTLSPWPLMISFCLMNLFMSILNWFLYKNLIFMKINLINLVLVTYQWWRDIIRESTYQGCHTFKVLNLMKFSMILFIISELFFFISLFWTYFHSCISPNIEIGNMWPPKNILMFNPYDIPLLNSIILVSSGFMITWSHNLLLNNKFKESKFSLLITIVLGIYFSMMQYLEYNESSFCINDSIFGSIFYLLTGFHGLHVIIGIIFLITCLLRMSMNHFSKIHHFHFESSSWYWHFVDIIWLFVYMFVYWWMY